MTSEPQSRTDIDLTLNTGRLFSMPLPCVSDIVSTPESQSVAYRDGWLYSGECEWQGVRLPNGATGYPSWDGVNRVALTARIEKMVFVVDVADEKSPRFLWSENLLGNPDRSFFWQGRLVIPCGYQGLLVVKTLIQVRRDAAPT